MSLWQKLNFVLILDVFVNFEGTKKLFLLYIFNRQNKKTIFM